MSDDDGANENDIAIVGMALRVPGANSPAQFWENLKNGTESIRDFDEETILSWGESKTALRNPAYVRRGGALDDIKLFDRDFFGFSPREASILDPQHRHFMELCWESLEDAGHVPDRFDGQIGVFAGCGMGSYFYFNVCSNQDLVDSVGLFLLRHTGNDKDFLATRVSYVLDLRGPSINVQTACSTSLVASHLACQSLLSGECDLALAGGITINFPAETGYLFREGEILAPDGVCRTFDARAQGTVLTSGGGVVTLRRLEDALEDGDPIYAVIKGSAVNNDGGQKVGYLAPSVDGQAAAMNEAYALSEIDPSTIGLIECHGTGTYMGDPIEVAALTQAFRTSTSENGICRIGSVKTNIGHLDTAAGVVGLMKAALSLQNAQMPASLHFENPNPEIGFENTPFIVNDSLREWESQDAPRRAAVNSLGVGGTNVHMIVEEAPIRAKFEAPDSSTSDERVLLQLAARNNASLDGASIRLAQHLRDHPEQPLADVGFSLAQTRSEMSRRRLLVATSRAEAIELLEQNDPRRVFTHTVADARSTTVFLFSGGGTQYPGMARGLCESEPVFRSHVERGLSLYQQSTGFDLSSLVLCPEGEEDRAEGPLEVMGRQLPAIFIVEYAMVQLLASKGIEPELLVGHSMGENVAACVAGVMSYEDCLDLLILRGGLMDRTPEGGMLAVSLPATDLEVYLTDGCDLATVNAPGLCVVSGARSKIDALEKRFADDEIDAQRVSIGRAPHSRMLDPMLEEFRTFVTGLDLKAPTIPILSNRTSKILTDEEAMSADYWVDHLRHTVHFSDGLAAILETPGRILIEVGPGQSLSSYARQQSAQGNPANIVSTLRHRADLAHDATFFLSALGRIWASGGEIDHSILHDVEGRNRVRLPTYAWDHQSYFIDRVEPSTVAVDSQIPERLEDLSEWGFEPSWKPASLDTRRIEGNQTWLIFMDHEGLGSRLGKRLEAGGHRVVRVFEGDSYRKRSEDEYSIAAELGREGYEALIRDLASLGRMPTQIVHLWLTSATERFRPGSSFFHENLQNGFFSLYFLARAIAEETTPGDVHWTIVSNKLHAVLESDDTIYPEKATVLGPALVIPRELPGVTCKTVDIALPRKATSLAERLRRLRGDSRPGQELEEIVDRLEEEVLVRAETDVVAHRGQVRYVRRFDARTLSARDEDTTPTLKDGGTYMITGGVGGIGATLADRISREVQDVRLVLVARTPIPERSSWDTILAGQAGTTREQRVVRRIQTLEAAGASVLTIAADVTNLEEMRAGIQSAREAFGQIDGIFHCAGIVDDELIQLKVDASIERVFGPKIHGTLVLDSLLEESGAAFFVLFSSTSALTGPAGQVDYVAANAFIDAYAQAHRNSSVRTLSINWGIWNEVGLAARSFGAEDNSPNGESSDQESSVSHPLLEVRRKDSHGRTGFVKTYSPQRDWILEEHRMADGRALFPGAGYPELARAALVEYGEPQEFEIHDLYFLRPLHVPDGEVREVRVQLRPTDQGYQFSVRTKVRVDGRPAWVLTCEASLTLGNRLAPKALDLAAIDARCQADRSSMNPLGHRSGQENHVRFGPRWRVLRQVLYGEGEALAHLELPNDFTDDLKSYEIHPALFDYATGYAMKLLSNYDPEESLWMPVSYERISVWAPLEKKISSLVRLRNANMDGGDFASFDVTIVNPEGRVLVEVENFTIKRVGADVDFSDTLDEATADLEFEVTSSHASVEDLSPAERQLRRNYEAGILPSEGIEALLRTLSLQTGPQVVISSIDLDFLFRQADRMASESAPGGTKFERPDLDSEYIEPRDEIEKTLVALWEELLGVDQLGIRDNFFDLGGHSLIAVRFFTKIKKTYRADFPISVLFEAPTIEGCAELIREALGDETNPEAAGEGASEESTKRKVRFKHLVAMDSGGGSGGVNSPFFLVAGMFGNVLNLRHLAALVGTDRPFYGLQARGLYGDEKPHETFEEMAAAYLEEIRTVQPTGPYYIGGFSGGGITAFEMAHQLLEMGEEVSTLVLLDSILPVLPPLSGLDRAKVQWIRLRQRGFGYAWEWARNRAKWQMEQLEARRKGDGDPAQGEDEFHNVAIERAFRGALPIYTMKRYPGHLNLFRPALDCAYELGGDRVLNSDKQPIWPDNGWSQWAHSTEVSEMPGDHDSMVLEPNVRVMATKLRELLMKQNDE